MSVCETAGKLVAQNYRVAVYSWLTCNSTHRCCHPIDVKKKHSTPLVPASSYGSSHGQSQGQSHGQSYGQGVAYDSNQQSYGTHGNSYGGNSYGSGLSLGYSTNGLLNSYGGGAGYSLGFGNGLFSSYGKKKK